MDQRLLNYLFKVTAAVCAVLGLVAVVIGYLGVRGESDIVLQLPYLASGGLGGLALIGIGAMALIRAQMREQTARFAELTEQLDDWKAAALAEVRTFLEGAQLEIEVSAPDTNGRRAPAGREQLTP
ncbi:MAG: hypothetical protein M3357_18440 [Actinomycetota bacterium]|jgi:hypothetical protein|nr:hypothetical protein [Actinomycetota bacterium]